jgi:hypothetical protein
MRGYALLTDPLPETRVERELYLFSERAGSAIWLPPAREFRDHVRCLDEAMADESMAAVRTASRDIVGYLDAQNDLRPAHVMVLGRRPIELLVDGCPSQVFGDYRPTGRRIRLYAKTAIQGRFTTLATLMNTLLHEFCHHLEAEVHGLPLPHTRGFYARVDRLYHHALATPRAERRELRWIERGDRWQLTWSPRPGTRAAR